MENPQVVRVFATAQEPDYEAPWQASTPHRSTGSGVVIGGEHILTGAHVVADATFLQVQKLSAPDKAVAQVAAVCHDADLALLRILDPAFLADVEPAEIGDLPRLRDKVSVVGFPIGGEEVSITEGVVSRIEVQRYTHSQRRLLAVTVDAAINEGSSGGPVFKEQDVVGIAFQKLQGADNIGEMVPAPIIKAFLAGIAAGRAPVVPSLGIRVQNLENPLLRQRLGMAEGDSGVLVCAIEYGGAAWGVLQVRDAVMAIEGAHIANNGTIQYAGRHRTRFNAVLGHHYAGDAIALDILRGGERMKVSVTLQPSLPLVPRAQYDRLPTYFVYGGLVFQTLTRDFLATWDKWWHKAPKEFLHDYYSGMRTPLRQEVVILTQILSDEINVGYADLYNESVVKVNGAAPVDMADFVRRVEAARPVVEIETSSGGVAVFETDAARAANARILARYHIGRDRSADLVPVTAGAAGPQGAAGAAGTASAAGAAGTAGGAGAQLGAQIGGRASARAADSGDGEAT